MDRRAILQAYFRHETIGLWDCCWYQVCTTQQDAPNLGIDTDNVFSGERLFSHD